jgi:hypothetical protein
MESRVGELSAAGSAFWLVTICLLLAVLLVWACYDAELKPPPSYVRDLLLRSRARYWKS